MTDVIESFHYRKSTETLDIIIWKLFLCYIYSFCLSTLASFLISSDPTSFVTLKTFSFSFAMSLYWSDKAGGPRRALGRHSLPVPTLGSSEHDFIFNHASLQCSWQKEYSDLIIWLLYICITMQGKQKIGNNFQWVKCCVQSHNS